MSKIAATHYPVQESVSHRWSPYAFDSRAVPGADLGALFEAARWAPSSFNEQPWSFIVAVKKRQPEEFERLLSCLVEANQAWVEAAPILVLAVTSSAFARNGKENAHARYDLGQAVAGLAVEATARGISVHQMAGFVPERARELYAIPALHEAVTAMAIGYAASVEDLPEALAERETAPRQRKALRELVFTGKWGNAADLAG